MHLQIGALHIVTLIAWSFGSLAPQDEQCEIEGNALIINTDSVVSFYTTLMSQFIPITVLSQ